MDRIWLAVCALVMEAAWISGVGAVASGAYRPAATPLNPFPAALLTAGAGYACGRLLLRQAEDDPAPHSLPRACLALLLGLLWSIAAVSAVRHLPVGAGFAWVLDLPAAAAGAGRGLHPDLLATGLILFTWWRGQRSGATAPDSATDSSGAGSFGALVRAFGMGALLLSGALLIAGATGRTPPEAGLSALLLLGAGLPALSLARLREVRRDAEAAGSEAPAGVEGTWLRALALPLGAILAVSLVAGALLGDEAVRQVLREGLGQIGALIWAVLYWPLLGVAYAVELLLFVLTRVFPGLQETSPAARPDPLRDLLPEPGGPPVGAPPWVAALRWLLPGLVVLAVVAAFLATSRGVRPVPLPQRRRGPERESLWSWSTFWHAFREWLSGLGRRLRAARPGARLSTRPGPSPGDASVTDSGVRALYRRLLALGRDNGLPRAGAQTAREYFHSWRQALPGEEDAGALTAAYEQARYGRPDVSPPSADGLRGRLEHLGRLLSRRPGPERAAPRPGP